MAKKEKVLNDFHWKDEKGPLPIRPTLKPFQRQHQGKHASDTSLSYIRTSPFNEQVDHFWTVYSGSHVETCATEIVPLVHVTVVLQQPFCHINMPSTCRLPEEISITLGVYFVVYFLPSTLQTPQCKICQGMVILITSNKMCSNATWSRFCFSLH